jgi:hypothetical protein
METLFWFVLGAFVGWNFPQPNYMKQLQQKLVTAFMTKTSTDDTKEDKK